MAPQIALTPPERLFRKCLLECRDSMQHVPGMEGLELRWTGGWVRDKLMGNSSNDIDVALSTMTGWQFGQALQTYMLDHHTRFEDEAKSQGFSADIKALHKIEANPDKSKHLETITTKIFGIDVDFVNLRKEIYDEHSRNPQVEFGTPEEDALRRDACVNALFYNLDSQAVEDLTGRGLEDMEKRIIRTPLAPYQTFRDDPLRVLRLIRFAARLDFHIVPEALEAMQQPSIHQALIHKISRERVGVEVGKIMTGPRPYAGLKQIYDLGLYGTVFGQDPVEEIEAIASLRSLEDILQECASICIFLKPQDNPTLSWTLAAYMPYRFDVNLAVSAARTQIKAPNLVLKVLEGAIRNRSALVDIVNRVSAQEATRQEVGMLLRRAGQDWRYHVLFALLSETIDEPFLVVIEKYLNFARYVIDQKLESAAELKPILKGQEVQQAVGIARAGPWLKTALELLAEWQFEHPDGDAAEATAFIHSKRDHFIRS